MKKGGEKTERKKERKSLCLLYKQEGEMYALQEARKNTEKRNKGRTQFRRRGESIKKKAHSMAKG